MLETTNWETECRTNISNKLYQTLKVSKDAQEKSYQSYLMDYEKRATYEAEMEEVKEARPLVELTRE